MTAALRRLGLRQGRRRQGVERRRPAQELPRRHRSRQRRARASCGVPAIEIVGWAEKPAYDAASHRLVWAMSSRDKGAPADAPQGVNYNTYALGREGYFSLNLVTGLNDLPQHKGAAHALLGALEYNKGKRYADFNAQDRPCGRVRPRGTGGAAWRAKKLGLHCAGGRRSSPSSPRSSCSRVAVLGGGVRQVLRQAQASATAPRSRRAARARRRWTPHDQAAAVAVLGRQARQARAHRRHDAAVADRLRVHLRLALCGRLHRAAVRARDGPLHRGAPARPRRRRADLHSRSSARGSSSSKCRTTPRPRPSSASAARCWAASARLACYFIARSYDADWLLAVAYAGFFLNLFNLIPLSPFDGGRITAVLSAAHLAARRADLDRAVLLAAQPDADPDGDPRRAAGVEGVPLPQGQPRGADLLRRERPRSSGSTASTTSCWPRSWP